MALTLDQVETAIGKVLNGQSYVANGYTYTRADLAKLRDLRVAMQAQYGNAGDGKRAMFSRGRMFRG